MSDSVSWYVKGSYTVESALLIPLGFAIVFLCISTTLIFYDYTAGEAWLYRAVVRSCYEKEETDFDAESIPSAITEFSASGSDDDLKIRISLKGTSGFLTLFEKNLTGAVPPVLSMETEESKIYGEQVVRQELLSGEGE